MFSMGIISLRIGLNFSPGNKKDYADPEGAHLNLTPNHRRKWTLHKVVCLSRQDLRQLYQSPKLALKHLLT
jgi:hypothetical protein